MILNAKHLIDYLKDGKELEVWVQPCQVKGLPAPALLETWEISKTRAKFSDGEADIFLITIEPPDNQTVQGLTEEQYKDLRADLIRLKNGLQRYDFAAAIRDLPALIAKLDEMRPGGYLQGDFFTWLHDVTVAGYREEITIDHRYAPFMESLFRQKKTPDETVIAYKAMIEMEKQNERSADQDPYLQTK